jgi:hypothetical protein
MTLVVTLVVTIVLLILVFTLINGSGNDGQYGYSKSYRYPSSLSGVSSRKQSTDFGGVIQVEPIERNFVPMDADDEKNYKNTILSLGSRNITRGIPYSQTTTRQLQSSEMDFPDDTITGEFGSEMYIKKVRSQAFNFSNTDTSATAATQLQAFEY